EEPLLRVEQPGLAVRLAQEAQATLAVGAEQVVDRLAQQRPAAEAAQPLRHRVDVEHRLRVRVEQEQRVAALLEQRAGELGGVGVGHGLLGNSHGNTSTCSTRTRPSPAYWTHRLRCDRSRAKG